jgi:UrcA family protein
MNGRVLFAALLFTTGCSVQAPRAPESDGPASRVVYFNDLDLADSAAPRLLYERIKVAAMQVCGPVRAHDVAEVWVRPCVSHAIASAVAEVNDLHLRDGRFVLDGATIRD